MNAIAPGQAAGRQTFAEPSLGDTDDRHGRNRFSGRGRHGATYGPEDWMGEPVEPRTRRKTDVSRTPSQTAERYGNRLS